MTLKTMNNIAVLPIYPSDAPKDYYHIVHIDSSGKVEYVSYDRDSMCYYWTEYADSARGFRLEEAKEYLRSSDFTRETEFIASDGSIRRSVPNMLLVHLDMDNGNDVVRNMKNIRIVRFLGMAAELIS